jgi:23S rRNA (guanosine2251-2'-O)-methyltransferase
MRKLKNEELERLSVEEFKEADKTPITIVLDNIRSLSNIGSIFRTADAFKVERILLCGITARPPHREIQKTALGATESVDWEYFDSTENAVLHLKNSKYSVFSIEQTEKSILLQEFNPKKQKKIALIFGHEVKGVQQKVVDLSDACIEIPQFGTKHSFNVSVSAGIILWDIFKNLKYTQPKEYACV